MVMPTQMAPPANAVYDCRYNLPQPQYQQLPYQPSNFFDPNRYNNNFYDPTAGQFFEAPQQSPFWSFYRDGTAYTTDGVNSWPTQSYHQPFEQQLSTGSNPGSTMTHTSHEDDRVMYEEPLSVAIRSNVVSSSDERPSDSQVLVTTADVFNITRAVALRRYTNAFSFYLILDSGASVSLVNDRSLLRDMVCMPRIHISGVGGSELYADEEGQLGPFGPALFVPEIGRNILSLCAVDASPRCLLLHSTAIPT